MLPSGFTWIREGGVATSAHPAGVGELLAAREAGIRAVVSLVESPPPRSEFDECGLSLLPLPLPDFTAPTLRQIEIFADFMAEQIALGHAVLLHCGAGLGRSGTMAACHLVSTESLSAAEAIAEVRRLRPGSIETDEQEQVVHDWHEHIRSRATDGE
ncbi:dual specificity protein phosphatase family protein [Candidatus Sumerlaeota bacterium]|nr:dual specificity protein phosphatase family protein [Candidatus Sumerlaeota bacterium]